MFRVAYCELILLRFCFGWLGYCFVGLTFCGWVVCYLFCLFSLVCLLVACWLGMLGFIPFVVLRLAC